MTVSYRTNNEFARREAPKVSHVEPTEWSYLAGLLDGEGCIATRRVKRTGPYDNWHISLVITQRDPALIKWIESVIPCGQFRTWTRKDGYTYRRWSVSGAEAVISVLTGCLPYLTLKKPQAQLALELLGSPRPSLKRQQKLAYRIASLKKVNYL